MIYSAKKPDTFIFFVTRDPSPAEKPFRIAVAAEKLRENKELPR
jgi:hypothetical protein